MGSMQKASLRQRTWTWLLPPEQFPRSDGLAYQRAAAMVLLSTGGASILIALAIPRLLFDVHALAVMSMVAACGMLALLGPYRRNARPHLYGNAICLLLYGNVLAAELLTAGTSVGMIVSLPLFVFLTVLAMERIEALVWAAVAMATALASYLFARYHMPAVFVSSPAWIESTPFRAAITLCIFSTVIAQVLVGGFRAQQTQMDELRELERRRRRELDHERERISDFAMIAADWFWETDAEHRLVFISSGYAKLFGLVDDQMLGRTPLEVAQALDPRRKINTDKMAAMVRGEAFVNQHLYARGQNGEAIVLNNSGRPIRDADGRFLGFRGAVVDVSETHRLTRELRRLAESDPLTGLANRRCLHDTLDAQLRQEPPGWLVCMDLDRFKEVNDAYGHNVGDRLLVEVAGILRESVRGDDLVARMGGDEFAILLPGGNQTGAETVATRILNGLAKLSAQQHAFRNISASIGLASLTGITDADTALIYADGACYLAKRSGRGRYMLAGD